MKFSSYNLNPELINALNELDYFDLTPIQGLSLKDALKGKSMICKSATGSGKTHAFLVPVIQNLNLKFVGLQSVIIVPTVELCLQCSKFLTKIEEKYPYFKSVMVTSLRDKDEALLKLKNATVPTIVIATPGRLLDIFNKSKKSFNIAVSTLVYDEADMLFEESYQEESYEIFNILKPKQTLVFTATMKEHEIATLKKNLHISIVLSTENIRTSNTVKHQLINIRHLSKEEALEKYLAFVKPYFALVFCSSKKEIEKTHEYFASRDYDSYLLTGGSDSRQRKSLLNRLDKNDVHLVFASDVASRGIDFKDVSHVISLDLPLDTDYYYHRAGRSGRINKDGISVIFIKDENDPKVLKLSKNISFEKYILKDEGLKLVKERKITTKKKNEKLEQEIQREIRKSKSKIKPCYKKKRRTAALIAKKRHKKKVIRENILARKRKGTM